MIHPKRRGRVNFVAILICAALAGAALLAASRMLYTTNTWTRRITLDGEDVTVTINETVFGGLLKIGHEFLIPTGEWKYTTRIRFRDGRTIEFTNKSRANAAPRAIWKLQGRLYVACGVGGEWLVGSLDADGTITPVPRSKLPDGPRPWNLSQSPQEWEEDFQQWYK